jgi:hypothetical protein
LLTAEEVVAMVEAAVAMAEALVVGMVVAISVAGISPVAVAISLGLVGVILVGIALRNTEEGILITEIISGTIVISFLEVPSGMMTPTTGMIIIRTTDIRTMDIGTTAFTARSCSNPVDKLSITWPDRRSDIEGVARRLRCYSQPVFQGEYPGWSFGPGCFQARTSDFTKGRGAGSSQKDG